MRREAAADRTVAAFSWRQPIYFAPLHPETMQKNAMGSSTDDSHIVEALQERGHQNSRENTDSLSTELDNKCKDGWE